MIYKRARQVRDLRKHVNLSKRRMTRDGLCQISSFHVKWPSGAPCGDPLATLQNDLYTNDSKILIFSHAWPKALQRLQKTYERKSSMMRINPRNDRDTYSLLRGSKEVSQRVQKRPKGHQNDPKGWPKRCQETSKMAKESPRGPKGFKSTPKGYQRCPKSPQGLPNGVQKGAKKGPQKGAKRGSRRGP